MRSLSALIDEEAKRERTMKAPASATLRVRLLSDPCLWCWETFDPHRSEGVLYSSWANQWSAYESREEALRAGEACLAELQSSGAGRASAREPRAEPREDRGSAKASRRGGVNAAVTLLLIGVLVATVAPTRPTERVVEMVDIVRAGRRIASEEAAVSEARALHVASLGPCNNAWRQMEEGVQCRF